MEPFEAALGRHGISLRRGKAVTLQVNVGRLCNQACRHCHLDAGPDRPEAMTAETMEEVTAFAARCRFETIDVTGGAPELVEGIEGLLRGLAPLCRRLMFRTNLTAIAEEGRERLAAACRELKVSLVASFPSTSASQTASLRGAGVLERSLDALRMLNGMGFGIEGSGLELDLVVNPAGAFLPVDQCHLEKKFRADLERRWGIRFSRLYSFANVPLGRFRRWLEQSGNYDLYLSRLAESFNPATVPGLMCRSLVSVSWEGILYDCDFNQAAGLPLGGAFTHVSRRQGPPQPGTPIVVGDHCFACTAGSGFS